MQVNTIFSALAGAERVFTVMDAPAEEADMPDAVEMDDVKGEVTMEHVTFGYNPDKTILKEYSICTPTPDRRLPLLVLPEPERPPLQTF